MNDEKRQSLIRELSELAQVCPDVTTTQCYASALEILQSHEVYASWQVDRYPDDPANNFYISAGVNEDEKTGQSHDQIDGYFPNDDGAKLTIEHCLLTNDKGDKVPSWLVTLTVPAGLLAADYPRETYWLSPYSETGEEAFEWGMRPCIR